MGVTEMCPASLIKSAIPQPLIEPTYIHDTLASGIADIEFVSGCIARFTLYVESKGLIESAPPDRLVVARIAIPISALPCAIQQTLAFLSGNALGEVFETVQRLAH